MLLGLGLSLGLLMPGFSLSGNCGFCLRCFARRFGAWPMACSGPTGPQSISAPAISWRAALVRHCSSSLPIAGLSFREADGTSRSDWLLSHHVNCFSRLCASAGATGNLVAYLAAAAIETGATWVTADRGFARFAGLTVEHPLSGRS